MSWMAPDAMNWVTGENLLSSGTASAVMSTLLSLSKAVHGRVVNEPLDRAARERELGVHRNSTAWIAGKPIRGKPFTREFHCHRGFPASPWPTRSVSGHDSPRPYSEDFFNPSNWRS